MSNGKEKRPAVLKTEPVHGDPSLAHGARSGDPLVGAARVLVIEDYPDQAETLCRLLEALGYHPLGPLASGEAAVAAVSEAPPNLVLMDLLLAGAMDGITAAERIRALADVPVVFLTAHTDPPLLQRASEAAPYGYLVKPVTHHALHAALSVALHKHRADQELRRHASTDPLTGVYNRRHLGLLLTAEIRRAQRHRRPLSLILFDLDHFKDVNDALGHMAGDEVLRRVAAIVAGRLRMSDVLGRWGGEEFVVLVPETELASAVVLAETLRAALSEAYAGDPVPVTASFGVSEHRSGESVEAWMRRTDALTYLAKRRGRNRVVTDEQGGSDM